MLGIVDLIIIILYLAGTILAGILCRGKQENADDYFTAGGRMTGFFMSTLVGLSIAATLFSGISFLGYPSLVYSNGIGIILALISFPICWVVLRYWFLPRYMADPKQHPYNIIEKRLGANVRTIAATMYVLLRIGWMSALIYAPTLAIMGAANLSNSWFWPIILIIGISSTLYTTLGGIRGVIVTDAIQFCVIALGLFVTLGIIAVRLPVSFGEIVDYLNSKSHLNVLDFSLNPKKLITVWSVLLGINVSNFSVYMADQMSLQRYLSTGSVKTASKSFLTNIIGVMVIVILLVCVGLTLSVWYHFNPDANLPKEVDKIFPYFIGTQLPSGVAGLVLAAIIAATMSSMTSGINTLSATLTLDFRARLGKPMSPQQKLSFGRKCSIAVGIGSTVIAGFVGGLGSIFEITQALLGLFLGPILACMVLAIMNWKFNACHISIGLLCSMIVGIAVAMTSIANTWIGFLTFVVTILIAYISSVLAKIITVANTKKGLNCE